MRVEAQYIENRVAFVPESGCWIWMKALYPSGYGHLVRNKRHMAVHRAAYETYVGEIPDGALVLHKCDVRSCCNPSHLWLGTHADNMADMEKKGRARKVCGEAHPNAKFTEQQVKEIRERRAKGESSRSIAASYGVWETTISTIVRRRRWASV